MPLYDYKCPDCGTEFEATQPIARRHYAECPHCFFGVGEHRISPVSFNASKMGLDASFPTFADKWAKRHMRAAKAGQQE
jgi:putative FmdB family regulatory protein